MEAILQVVITGVALASLWFWICVALRVFDPRDRFWWWLRVIVPQGIIIAWALRISLRLFL
jgi:hypothetical protein